MQPWAPLIAAWLVFLPGLSVLAAESLSAFERGGLWGYRDGQGQVVIEQRFHVATGFLDEGIAAVADESAWAYIDRTGRVVIRPFVVDNGPDAFRQGLARFSVEGRFGYFDRRGRVAIEPRFDFATPFFESRAGVCAGCEKRWHGGHAVWAGGRWGYIDRAGKAAVPMIYDEIRPFEDGRAQVRRGRDWLSIDKVGCPSTRTGPS